MYELTREMLEDAMYRSDGLDMDNIRTDYSGRAMYGKTCLGLTGYMSDLMDFVLNVVPALNEDSDLVLDWKTVATDSMGLESIFYWPNIRVSSD